MYNKNINRNSIFCESKNGGNINMAMEQETESLIIFGFIIVLVIVAICIGLLWRKTRSNGLFWFIPQLGMLSLCLLLFIKLINNQANTPAPMLSEENSLTIGLMGVSWALSMGFMTIGISTSFKPKTRNIKIKS